MSDAKYDILHVDLVGFRTTVVRNKTFVGSWLSSYLLKDAERIVKLMKRSDRLYVTGTGAKDLKIMVREFLNYTK